jgi:hypothetical protein
LASTASGGQGVTRAVLESVFGSADKPKVLGGSMFEQLKPMTGAEEAEWLSGISDKKTSKEMVSMMKDANKYGIRSSEGREQWRVMMKHADLMKEWIAKPLWKIAEVMTGIDFESKFKEEGGSSELMAAAQDSTDQKKSFEQKYMETIQSWKDSVGKKPFALTSSVDDSVLTRVFGNAESPSLLGVPITGNAEAFKPYEEAEWLSGIKDDTKKESMTALMSTATGAGIRSGQGREMTRIMDLFFGQAYGKEEEAKWLENKDPKFSKMMGEANDWGIESKQGRENWRIMHKHADLMKQYLGIPLYKLLEAVSGEKYNPDQMDKEDALGKSVDPMGGITKSISILEILKEQLLVLKDIKKCICKGDEAASGGSVAATGGARLQ